MLHITLGASAAKKLETQCCMLNMLLIYHSTLQFPGVQCPCMPWEYKAISRLASELHTQWITLEKVSWGPKGDSWSYIYRTRCPQGNSWSYRTRGAVSVGDILSCDTGLVMSTLHCSATPGGCTEYIWSCDAVLYVSTTMQRPHSLSEGHATLLTITEVCSIQSQAGSKPTREVILVKTLIQINSNQSVYHITRIFGGGFNSAIWQLYRVNHAPNIKLLSSVHAQYAI